MIIVYVAVKTKEDTTYEFEHIMREIQTDVRKMAGCIKNEWYRDREIPQRYVFYGEFDTDENFEKYLNSSAVERIGHDLIPLLDAPPEFKHYSATLIDGN